MPRPIQYGQRAKFSSDVETTSPQPDRVITLSERHNALRDAVLDNLGRPDDLINVTINTLWDEDHYRVNIYREIRGLRTMTDSFFVYMLEDSVMASPRIDRKYYDDILDKLASDRGSEDEVTVAW